MNPERVLEAQRLLAQWNQHADLCVRFPLYGCYLEALAAEQRTVAVHQFLRPFLAQLRDATPVELAELIDAQCRSVNWRGRAHGSSPVPGLPFDYLESIVYRSLMQRRKDFPDDPWPHVWLALLPPVRAAQEVSDPRNLLLSALRLDPTNAFIAERLAEDYLEGIDFACHHLPDSLLAPIKVLERDGQALRALILFVPQERRGFFLNALTHYQEELAGAGHSISL